MEAKPHILEHTLGAISSCDRTLSEPNLSVKFSSLGSMPLDLDVRLLNFLAVCKFNSARLKVLEGTDSRI
jgi:hypothetical protein